MARKILVIDDEISFAVCLKEYLDTLGHEVRVVSSAGEAFECLDGPPENAFYEIIISDVNMPGITGMTLLKAIKNRSPLSQVLLMSGYGTERMVVEGLEKGACDFLFKPFELKLLGEIISNINAKLTRWEQRGISVSDGVKKNG